MSFWEDLQAWTQAQYDALVLANLKRKKKWTAQDINRLLRDRVSKRLKAKQGRAIGAEFLRTAGRLVPDVPLPTVPQIDHGWLTGPYTDTVIYAWASLAATLVTQGYTLGASDEYDSVVTRTATLDLYPETYSGLTRLLVQSFVGSGRPLSEIQPATWDVITGPVNGLVRSPAGVYWLTASSSSLGLKMSRLAVPAELAAVAAAVNAGTYPAGVRELAESVVIGSLTLADPEDTVQVLVAAESPYSGVYADSHANQQWGWCWRYQRRGAADQHLCGAVINTWKLTTPSAPSKYIQFRESVMAITFDGAGRPSATITETASGYVQPIDAGDSVYLLDKSGTYNQLRTFIRNTASWQLAEPPGNTTEHGILLSCYGPDGDVDRLEVTGRAETVTESYTEPNQINWCPEYIAHDYAITDNVSSGITFAGKTFNNAAMRSAHYESTADYALVCPTEENTTVHWGDGTAMSSDNVLPCDVIVAGPGLVFIVGWITPYVYEESWSLDAIYGEISCFCDGTEYGISARTLIQEAITYGSGYTDSGVYTDGLQGVTVCNHDAQTPQGDTGNTYDYLTDLLSTASTTYLGTTIKAYDTVSQSYAGQINILGDIYPTGLDATGAEIDGRFVGGV